MRLRLSATPLVVQLPLGEGRAFRGVVDLVAMDAMLWQPGSDGDDFSLVEVVETGPMGKDFRGLTSLPEQCNNLPVSKGELEAALEARAQLAEQVCTGPLLVVVLCAGPLLLLCSSYTIHVLHRCSLWTLTC